MLPKKPLSKKLSGFFMPLSQMPPSEANPASAALSYTACITLYLFMRLQQVFLMAFITTSFWQRSLVITLASLCLSCAKPVEVTKLEGFAQGTTYHLTYVAPAELSSAQLHDEVEAELQRIDDVFSNYRDDSVIEKFNAEQSTEPLAVTEEMTALIDIARSVHSASHGCYDLTIKPLFDLWGFKKDEFSPPTEEALAQTLANIGMDKLETPDRSHWRKQLAKLRVDVSSIGQGYAVGQIVKIFNQHNIENYLVEIGGELQARGKKPNGDAWRVGLDKPLPNERKLQKIVSFDSGAPMALMTSGTYRHYFDSDGKRYSHILDARSGKPVEHNTVSVTILHPNPSIADAWSTALNCLGSKEGMAIANDNKIAVLFIDQEGDQLIESESQPMQDLTDVSFSQK
jgi:FAD:protein FMN transferase